MNLIIFKQIYKLWIKYSRIKYIILLCVLHYISLIQTKCKNGSNSTWFQTSCYRRAELNS